MTGTSTKTPVSEPFRSIIFLGTVILLRVLGQYLLYLRGFLSVSADEYARGIHAASWASAPKFDLFDGPPGAWLPFEKYLNGLLLTVWPDVVLAPRVTVFLSSCLALICLFLLARRLFSSWTVAALTILLVVFQPWVVWLSGTPMLEMYYLSFYLAGLFLLLRWLRDGRHGDWILAGLGFMIATGFHVQSWYMVNIVNLLTIGYLFNYARRRQFGHLRRLIGYYLLSNALIIALLVIEYVHNGTVLGFLSSHTSYSLWFYSGYEVNVLEKLSFYPRLIVENVSAAIWPLVLAALLFIRTAQDRRWKLFPLAVAVCTLILSSVANVLSGPPSAAPARYSLFYVLILAPYIAYGAYRLFTWALQRPSRLVRYSLTFLPVALFAYSVIWGALRTVDHPGGKRDALQAGQQLNALLNHSDPTGGTKYMLELAYWDFLAVQLTAGHYDNTLFDRVRDIRDRDTPSIFEKEPGQFYDDLLAQRVAFVALTDSDLKEIAEQSSFLLAQYEVGDWTIYQFEP